MICIFITFSFGSFEIIAVIRGLFYGQCSSVTAILVIFRPAHHSAFLLTLPMSSFALHLTSLSLTFLRSAETLQCRTSLHVKFTILQLLSVLVPKS
jgi:hypothetical protein